MENKITTIERGAFQDLKELERLWVFSIPNLWRYNYIFNNTCISRTMSLISVNLQKQEVELVIFKLI